MAASVSRTLLALCLARQLCCGGWSRADSPCNARPPVLGVGVLLDSKMLPMKKVVETTFTQLNHGVTSGRLQLVAKYNVVDLTDSFAASNAMCELISSGVVAILGVSASSALPTVQSYSSTFHVPFITIGATQNFSVPGPFQIFMRPPFMTAVVDVIHFRHCQKVFYIYDSDEGLMRLQDLFQSLNSREADLELDVRRVGSMAALHVLITSLPGLGRVHSHVVLDLDLLDVLHVVAALRDSAEFDFARTEIFIVTLDTLQLFASGASLQLAHANISGFQLVNPAAPNSSEWNSRVTLTTLATETFPSSWEGVLVDGVSVLHRALTSVLDSSPDVITAWSRLLTESGDVDPVRCTNFIIDKLQHGDLLHAALIQVKISGWTGAVAFDELGRRRFYSLAHYSLHTHSPSLVGVWREHSGLAPVVQQVEERTYIVFANDSDFANFLHLSQPQPLHS